MLERGSSKVSSLLATSKKIKCCRFEVFFSFLKCCFGQTCLWLKRRNRKVPKTTSTNSSSSVSRIRSGARIRAKFLTSLSDASIADTGSARQIWPNSSSTFSTAAKPSHSRYLTDPGVPINSLPSSQL